MPFVRYGLSLACLAATALTGCGPGTQQLTGPITDRFHHPCPGRTPQQNLENGGLYQPDPVCDTYMLPEVTVATAPGAPLAPASSGQQAVVVGTLKEMTAAEADARHLSAEWTGAAISDSQTKCATYLGRFTGNQAGESIGFDVTALVLSGLAAVFTPVNTVRGLAAASTAVQGTKAAVNNDLFQQITVLLFAQQINATYYPDIKSYAETTLTKNPPTPAALTYAEIQRIHHECSFINAITNIAAKTPAPGATSTTKIDLATLAASTPKDFQSGTSPGRIYEVTKSSATPPVYSLRTKSPPGGFGPLVSFGTDPTVLQDFLNADQAKPTTP
jgi:hypothetical protein